MPEDNPFVQTYEALWAMALSHAPLAALVKPGNRVKLDKPLPVKEQIATADLPELRLVPINAVPHLQRTSNGSSFTQIYEWQVASGSQEITNLQGIEWELYCAMAKWATVLQALTWNGKTFVRLARPQTINQGVFERDLNRGIQGWSAIWACEVEMWFDTSDLQA